MIFVLFSSYKRVEHPSDPEPVRGQPGEPKVCRVPNQGGRRRELTYNGVHRRGRDHSDQRRFDSFTVSNGFGFIQLKSKNRTYLLVLREY